MDRQNSEATLMLNLAIKQPPQQRIIMYRDTRGGNSHRLGYGMCHFLRVLFWLENKFLGLFYSL